MILRGDAYAHTLPLLFVKTSVFTPDPQRRRQRWSRTAAAAAPGFAGCAAPLRPNQDSSLLYIPVPDSDTLSGAAVTLFEMTNLADRLVVVFGLKVTLTLQEAPAGSAEGQFSVMANQDA